jgi:hypothetical protein
MKKAITFISSLAFVLFCMNVSAQQDAIKPEVKHPVYFDVSPPLRDMVKNSPEKADNTLKVIKNYFNARKNKNKESFSSDWVDPLIQHIRTSMTTQQDSTIQNFLGNTNTQGYDPPDTYGQVGPNDYFALVNCHFTIYSKTGALLLGPVSNMTIWNGMPNNMNGGDGVVCYDAQADRWIFAQLSYPGSLNFEMIAVSQTPDPTGSWYRWEYAFLSTLPDYPKFGVWPDGYYMSVNRFDGASGNYLGTGQAVFDRNAMIAGDSSARMVYLTLPSSNNAYSCIPSSCDGGFPPLGTPNYFVYMNDAPDYLGVYQFHVDWTNTANSTFGNYLQLPVTTFNDNLPGIPQKGTSRLADALSDRLMYRLQFRDFSDHWSMVVNHTVNVGSNVAGIRWYELRKTTGDWSIYQQSTYAPADTNSRWMGSVAMDTAGNIGMGYSISSTNMYPAIKFTGRLQGDPLNTLDLPEKGIFYGTGSNTANDGGGICRWGDYSSATIDPSDGMTFWYTQEYLTSMGSSWKTRVASFSFKGMFNVLLTATPDTLCSGDSTHLNASASVGSGPFTYSWTSNPVGFTSNIKNPVVSPLVTTKYIVTITDSTFSKADSIIVTVNGLPTANAGANASYPNTAPSFPVAGTATNYSNVKWLTAGDGYFNIDTVLSSVYFPGANDRHDGGVLLSLLAYPMTPCSDTATDTVFITLSFPLGVASGGAVPFDVNIVPNPSTGMFNLIVHGVSDMDLMIMITNLEGKAIFMDKDRPESQDYSKTIDITSFPKGIYMVKVQTDTQSITKKLVIQ